MFSTIAFAIVVGVSFASNWSNSKEPTFDELDQDSAAIRGLVLHIRQDVKLLCFLLMGIIVMLGVVADHGF
jgi:hypothetical protein